MHAATGMQPGVQFKIPVSVLVVIHTPDLQVLVLERSSAPGFWQSVTGSVDYPGEPLHDTAVREVREETAIDALAPGHHLVNWEYTNRFEIYKRWVSRYGPGVTHNIEHVWGLTIPAIVAPTLTEHLAYEWLPWRDAADKCFSWSNAEAIRQLPERAAFAG
jgi:dihydroneopterin triphosphate diphosphatase